MHFKSILIVLVRINEFLLLVFIPSFVCLGVFFCLDSILNVLDYYRFPITRNQTVRMIIEFSSFLDGIV